MVDERPRTGFGSTAFYDRLFAEALGLCRETREYMNGAGGRPVPGAAFDQQLAFCLEGMRLTARLTQVMAWLLVQRAAAEGEIEPDELARESWRLSGQAVCLAEPAVPLASMPGRLRALVERGERLYRRVARLDEMVARAGV
jgi:regulator of CtrA degradation